MMPYILPLQLGIFDLKEKSIDTEEGLTKLKKMDLYSSANIDKGFEMTIDQNI